MGYFDALTTGSFKTGQDGQKLFFPWGVLGRGYAVGSEADYERLRKQIKTFMIVSLGSLIVLTGFTGTLVTFAIAGAQIVFYSIWMMFLLPRLKQSTERMTMQESMTAQARTHSKVGLWLLEIASVAFVATGVFLFFADPGSRLIAIVTVVFFGLCTAKATHLLVLRYRADANRP